MQYFLYKNLNFIQKCTILIEIQKKMENSEQFWTKNFLNYKVIVNFFSYIPSWNNLTDEILWNKKKVKYESLWLGSSGLDPREAT